MSRMLLYSPAPLRSLREVPWLGTLIHRLSHRLIPADQKLWARIEAGPGEGLWIELNPRTGQSYVRGKVETAVQKIFAERLKPGMILYDLGANIGFFTLLAARLVGEAGRVFSFEPDSENAARLRRNIQRNGFTNVTVVDAGIWSITQNLSFVAADFTSPDHGIGRFISPSNRDPGTLIPCVSLDDFIKYSPLPDAIKCDVEGAEIEALRGAEKLLRAKHPWIICEMHSPENDRAAREILSRFDYTLEAAEDGHILAFVSPDSNRGSNQIQKQMSSEKTPQGPATS
jgi:FkbM family methyltransferase